MKRKELLGIAAVAVVLAVVSLVWFGPWQGERAPDVRFTTLEGRQFELAELHGQPVLLTFWATTCPSCVAEIPHLRDLYQELGPRGLEVIGVAMYYDPPNQVRAMAAERQINYPVALDAEDSIATAFGGIRLTPTTVLINPDGRIVWRRLGDLNMPQVRQQIIDMLPAS